MKRPILRYHGGKWRIAHWVISHFPSHKTYIEPFSGAASVLLQKKPARAEVLNDLNGRIISCFRVLRDPDLSKKLKKNIRFTPCSELEYQLCRDISPDPVEDARRLIVLGHQGHGSTASSGGKMSGWRRGVRKDGSANATEWAELYKQIEFWADRLRQVYLENCNAIDLIKRWDSLDALFYVDPPYPRSTRTSKGNGYAHEMTDDQHRELTDVLRNIKGKVIISGYACDLYDKDLYPDWIRIQKKVTADMQTIRTEVLWLKSGYLKQESLF